MSRPLCWAGYYSHPPVCLPKSKVCQTIRDIPILFLAFSIMLIEKHFVNHLGIHFSGWNRWSLPKNTSCTDRWKRSRFKEAMHVNLSCWMFLEDSFKKKKFSLYLFYLWKINQEYQLICIWWTLINSGLFFSHHGVQSIPCLIKCRLLFFFSASCLVKRRFYVKSIVWNIYYTNWKKLSECDYYWTFYFKCNCFFPERHTV